MEEKGFFWGVGVGRCTHLGIANFQGILKLNEKTSF